MLQQLVFLGMIGSIPTTIVAQSYWQQEVDYTIDVRLDDVAHVLHAYGRMLTVINTPLCVINTIAWAI